MRMKPFYSKFIPIFLLTAAVSAQDMYQPLVSAAFQPGQGRVLITLQVDPGYHITDLKNKFFTVELEANDYLTVASIKFPAGVPFENEMVFKDRVELLVILTKKKPLDKPLTLNFNISYQICQERPVAVCFAPDSQKVPIVIYQKTLAAAKTKKSLMQAFSGLIRKVQDLLRGEGARQQPLLVFSLTLLLGFFTSLTPCVYPVIPIIMGYVGGRSQGRKGKAFFLSLFFVLGLTVVYTLLGVTAALAGSMLGSAFQKPIVIVGVAAVFILMGLSMAGLFNITPPAWLSSHIGRGGKNEWLSAILLGGVAALIAAPCAGPVLGAVLTWIASNRDVFLGFFFMLAFSLGMGAIFLLVGTFTGVVSSLPRGGKWMENIKYFFAVILIGAGIFILGTVSPAWLRLVYWGIYLVALSVFLGPFTAPSGGTFSKKLRQVVAVLLLTSGIFLFWKGLEKRYFPGAASVTSAKAGNSLPWLADIDAALARARSEKKKVMIDTYADWCLPCHELEEKTFSRPEVQKVLVDFILVKLDFTDDKSVKNKALARRFAIIGNPTVIFLTPEGAELSRFSGFKPADEFLEVLKGLPGD